MLTAADMRRVRIVVLERDEERVARALGELGVVHLQSSVEESRGELEPEQVGDEIDRCVDLGERVRRLMDRLGVPPGDGRGAAGTADPDRVAELVGTLQGRVAPQIQELERTESAASDTREILDELAPYRALRVPLSRLADSALLEMRAGRAMPDRVGEMRAALPEGVLLVPLGEEPPEGDRPVPLLAISSRRRRFAMETVLQEHGFEERPLPPWAERTPADLYDEASATREELDRKAADLRARLHGVGGEFGGPLREAAAGLEVRMRLLEAEKSFGTTWTTVVISGYVPADRADELQRAAREASDGRCVVEVTRPDRREIEEGRVPSQVIHSRLLAPFERLVRGYGVAGYAEIEPTVMFAASFLLLFGVVFGDLGHGLCLLGVGLAIRRLSGGETARDIGFVAAAAGISSALFGAFFQGAFFGRSLREMGFALTLGFEPMRFEGEGAGAAEHVVRYLMLSVGVGVALISVGAGLNIVNRLRSGDWLDGLLSRFGVVGLVFYWGSLGLGARLGVGASGAADAWLAVLAVGLPLVAVVLHRPLSMLLGEGQEAGGGAVIIGLFEGLTEALETILTYMANTASFLRVAAFALSHAALSYTIFVLQRLVGDLPAGIVWSAIVFLSGTALIIGLEGLIVTIQILRLEYYEFFGKFFGGQGRQYEPFRLR